MCKLIKIVVIKKKRDQPGLALGGIFYRRAKNTVDIRSRGESNPAGLGCKTATLPLSYCSVLQIVVIR
jgi:hypothetical protein